MKRQKAQGGEIPNVQWPAPEPAAPPGSMITVARPIDPYMASGEVLRAHQQQAGVLAPWLHLVSLDGRPAAIGTLLLRCDTEGLARGDKLATAILLSVRRERRAT